MINCPQFTRKPHGDTARKVGLLLFLLALTEPGFAQEPRSSTRFGAPKLPTIDQPEYLKKEPKPTLGLPPVEPAVEPTPAPQERVPEKGVPLSEAGLVMVRRFAFEGNRVFTDAQLAEVTTPYEGRPITSEELQYVRYALTLFYVEQGYINSGVVIPDQEVKDGVVRLRVVEGRLTRIEVSGNQRLRTPYIEKRLALGEGPPLNLFDLQHQVQMLDQNPLIEQINADLGPGLAPGEAVLRARVVEADPLSFGFETNNYRSPSVGATQLVGWAGNDNLTGWGDSAYVSYAISEGIDDWNLN